jgi:transposase InsO family protein
METAAAFLENTLAQCPFRVEKLLTDNGIEFSYNPLPDGKKPKAKEHPFVALCKAKQIDHRTTLAKHPWTNGRVEAMNKKVKANTNHRFHYDDVDALKTHLYYYRLNYNFSLKLKALGRKTPFETILQEYEKQPDIFVANPNQLKVGLNTQIVGSKTGASKSESVHEVRLRLSVSLAASLRSHFDCRMNRRCHHGLLDQPLVGFVA